MSYKVNICWKCSVDINTNTEVNWIHMKQGNFNYCPSCFKEFLVVAIEFFNPYKRTDNDLKKELRNALRNWHYENHDKTKIFNECVVCKELLSLNVMP